MDKEKYFKISRELGFPNRCPILNYCCRRAWTVGYLSGYASNEELKKDGVIPKDFEEKAILIQGEAPGGSIGKGHGYFHNLCPEVSLFDTMNSLSDFKGTACTSGSFDVEEKPGFRIQEEKHFSECSEFSNYLFEHKSFNANGQTQQKTKPKECYTYLMFDKKDQLYKIGYSNSPKFREKTLHGQQPLVELVAFRKFESKLFAKNLETELHFKYKEKRTRGEWFNLNENDVGEILEVLNEK